VSSYFKFLRRVRIHGRECGAVARALRHEIEANPLSAADKKVLSTTNERKVMSKTTFFKRIALTAIAALGFGMLSVAPSQAVAAVPTITVTAGSASTTSGSGQESVTAAAISVVGLLGGISDSYTVSIVRKSAPATAVSDDNFRFGVYDTVTYATTRIGTASATAFSEVTPTTGFAVKSAGSDSATVTANRTYVVAPAAASNGWVGARFFIALDSNSALTRSVGDYVFTAIVTPISNGTAGTPINTDVTFTINQTAAVLAAASGTIDSTKTTAFLGSGTAVPTADGANITAVSTSSNTTRATLSVRTYTSASLQAPESVTVTITGAGIVGTSATGVYGKSITVAADGAQDFLIRSDGTAGTSSIVVSTPTKTFAAKTMRFYALAASTVTVSVNKPVIGVVSTTDTVRATFLDASGNVWAGAAYIYAVAAADALIAGSATTPALCTWDSTDNRHECTLTGKTAGTGNYKVIDASTVALATTTSDAVAVRVSQGAASSVQLSFDKATYAPGEKAQLRVLVLDGAGLNMPAGTISNVFAAPMTVSKAFGAGSATITSLDAVIEGATVAAADLNAGHQTYVVYMPNQGGAVTVSAVGGTGLVAAGRVAVSATATVVDTSDAATIAAAEAATDAASEAIDAANAATDAANLAAEAADAATVAAEEARDAADAATAAVEALATEVATLMAALKAQITTLANTVAKIAKKVKA
jgi:hypothetical protein